MLRKTTISPETLRKKAGLLAQNEHSAIQSLTHEEIQALFHELNIQQIELEKQNEQLKITQQKLIDTQNSFIQLFEYAPVGYLRLDNTGWILQSNITFQKMLGKHTSQVNGKYLANFICQDDLALFNGRYKAFYNRPENKVIELRMLKDNGEAFFVEIKGRQVKCDDFIHDQNEAETCLLVNIIEIGDHIHLEEDLRLAATVFENSEEGIMIVDRDNIIQKVNFSFSAVTGYEEAEVIGKSPRILKSGTQSKTFYEAMWNTLKKEGHWQGEIWNRRKNGDLYAEWLSITCITDKLGRVTHYIGIFSDITQRKQDEKQIQHLAHFDTLTELPNRTLLNDRLKQALIQSTRYKQWLAVFFLDLDHFKTLNDTLGHFVGDLLMQEVTKRLIACVRESDTVARFGGDEFVIVLPDFDNEETARVNSAEIANKILAELSRAFDLSGNKFVTSTSIGFSLFPKDGRSATELIKNADTAMYHAKAQGRNNVQYFSETMRKEALNRGILENELHKVIDGEEFIVFYQPIVDLQKEGRITSFEALVRWQHPSRGLLSPDEFIPIAEESSMIINLGKWVLKTACAQLKNWHDAGHADLRISVNLSARQFLQNDLISTINDILKETQLSANYLDLEITETVMMQNMNEVCTILKKLVRSGSTVTLDDFGTGYSSLTYLKKFPINRIKIDRYFIKDILTDPDDKMIVKSIIAIAKHMRLDIVAEGIENEAQKNYLIKQNCLFAQGYYFAKPLPAEEVVLNQK